MSGMIGEASVGRKPLTLRRPQGDLAANLLVDAGSELREIEIWYYLYTFEYSVWRIGTEDYITTLWINLSNDVKRIIVCIGPGQDLKGWCDRLTGSHGGLVFIIEGKRRNWDGIWEWAVFSVPSSPECRWISRLKISLIQQERFRINVLLEIEYAAACQQVKPSVTIVCARHKFNWTYFMLCMTLVLYINILFFYFSAKELCFHFFMTRAYWSNWWRNNGQYWPSRSNCWVWEHVGVGSVERSKRMKQRLIAYLCVVTPSSISINVICIYCIRALV